MEARPKLTIKFTKADKVLEVLCLTFLLVLWIATIAGFSKLPQQIPSHFNLAGQADGYSDKASIFTLPFLATVLYTGMTILNKYPHIYNYPTTITLDNARGLYTSATKLIRVLKLSVVIIFTGIVFMTYKSVFTHDTGLGWWFIPVAIVLMIVPNIYFLFTSSNQKAVTDTTNNK